MNHLHVIDTRVEVAHPRAGARQNDGHGRQGRESLLVDEAQLLAAGRIVAEADAQGIEHRVGRRVGLPHVGDGQRNELFVIDGHQTGSQVKMSLDRSSGVRLAAKAPFATVATSSGVHPSEICTERMGRGWLNR